MRAVCNFDVHQRAKQNIQTTKSGNEFVLIKPNCDMKNGKLCVTLVLAAFNNDNAKEIGCAAAYVYSDYGEKDGVNDDKKIALRYYSRN